MRINPQSSSCHQCFYIVGVDIQGFIVLIHGFHMTTMFEVVHTCTHTDRKRKLENGVDIHVNSEEARGRLIIIMGKLFALYSDNYNNELKTAFSVLVKVKLKFYHYHFKAHDADCLFLITEAKSSSRKSLL